MRNLGLKVNASKSFFAKGELEYLGYWTTRDGIQPLPDKIKAIQNIAEPTTRKQLRGFIGMINYYRDMWSKRSHYLAPLSQLTSNTVPFKWTEVESNAFKDIKKMLCRETMLAFPDYSKAFEIHTDASAFALGAVISQNKKPIAFYSRKLNFFGCSCVYHRSLRGSLLLINPVQDYLFLFVHWQLDATRLSFCYLRH